MKAKCAWCGELKEVYALKEGSYEDYLEDYADFVAEGNAPLKEGDVIGYPCCRECYESGQVA